MKRQIKVFGGQNAVLLALAFVALGTGLGVFVVSNTGAAHDLGGIVLGFGLALLPTTLVAMREYRKSAVPSHTHAATAPEGILEKDQISNMAIGTMGYTLPWAMIVTSDGRCFLNGGYTFDPRPGGSVTMRVTRTSKGWEVFVPPGHKYERADAIPFVGASSSDLIPVAVVHAERDAP